MKPDQFTYPDLCSKNPRAASAFLSALAVLFPEQGVSKDFAKGADGKGTHEVSLVVNGRPVSFAAMMNDMVARMEEDRQEDLRAAAQDLLERKLRSMLDRIDALEHHVASEVDKVMSEVSDV